MTEPTLETDPLTPVQRAWVDALRSGEYTQTQGTLAAVDDKNEPIGFCCLGVLCDLGVKAGLDLSIETESFDSSRVRLYNGEASTPPVVVVEWARLTEDNPEFASDEGPTTSLASENDDGKTFAEIADMIEANADALFVKPETAP